MLLKTRYEKDITSQIEYLKTFWDRVLEYNQEEDYDGVEENLEALIVNFSRYSLIISVYEEDGIELKV